MNKREIKIYIASPYTNGWHATNVGRQIRAGIKLIELGYSPYVPLLTHFMELHIEEEMGEHVWMDVEEAFLKTCNALLRLRPVNPQTGEEIPSPGSDHEESVAREYHIPVFYSIEELDEYFSDNVTQGMLRM